MNSVQAMVASESAPGLPDIRLSVRKTFGIDSDMEVAAYSQSDEHVPDFDPDYLFDRDTTLAILAGFAFNRRVMITGYHGTGKSTHVEQVAARLKWPCVRINLDSHVLPHRSRRQGRDRAQGRQADHGIPRRHVALGDPEQHRLVLRRV